MATCAKSHWIRVLQSVRTSCCVLLALLLPALVGAADDWQQGQLPWGDPDLQGTWTSATITRLQRPEELPNLVLTEAEAADAENRTGELFASIDEVPEGDLEAGDVGGYNSFWMDPGTRLARVNGEARSSIIIDPEDGQVP